MCMVNRKALLLLLSFPAACIAGMVPVQVGAFSVSQGKSQNINIETLIGNFYNVNKHYQSNSLFGLGYFMDAFTEKNWQVNMGVNGFYFGKTSVSGSIAQENLFGNLDYSYRIRHLPLYLAAKVLVNSYKEKYNLTLDAGLGSNFIQTSHYSEIPLNNYTLPDNAFASNNRSTFSAMAGIGLRLNNFIGKAPLECGYRFFYLGQGQLSINNTQILNPLKTGHVYANAVLCSLTAW